MPLRRRSVPAAVQAVVLGPSNRRVGWAVTSAGAAVVASEAGLVLPGATLLAWWLVEKVSWQPPLLEVVEVAPILGSGTRHLLELTDPGNLPAVLRTRVTASVFWTRHYDMGDRGGVRVVARRTGSQGLDWQLVYDVGTQVEHPEVQAAGAAALASARRSFG